MSKLSDAAEVYLNSLFNLNLYTPRNVYDLNSGSLNSIVSTVISGLENNSYDFSNSILGRVLLPNTPIQQIGNVELAKALALRVSKNLRTNILPTVTINYNGISITDGNYWNISGNDINSSFSSLLETILGFQPPVNPIPLIGQNFSNKASDEYLKSNRGTGQKTQYQSNISLNDYSPDDENNQYGSSDDLTNNKSILARTNKIISNNSLTNGYPALTGKEGDSVSPDAKAYNDLNNPGKVISRGDGTKVNDGSSTFLRVFNFSNPYQTTSDLMKFKHGTAGSNSVLQTVFPNISPLSSDKSVKNLMFSIENLAFADGGQHQLKPYEIGSNGGRIMWFPPYDLHFNENTTNEWETVKFIGRTEPIYTFNGGERSINISFKLIVDYPSSFWDNSWKTASNNEYDKFFRQDNTVNRNMSIGDNNTYEVQQRLQQTPLTVPVPTNTYTSDFEFSNRLIIHFDNDKFSLNQTLTQDINGVGQIDNDNFFNQINDLIDFLNTDDGQKYTVYIDGFASKLFTSKYNKVLSFFRAKSIYDYILPKLRNVDDLKLANYPYTKVSQLDLPTKDQYSNNKFQIAIHGYDDAENANASKSTLNQDVVDRKSTIYVTYNPLLDKNLKNTKQDKTTATDNLNSLQSQQTTQANKNIKGGEQLFFERLQEGNKLIYDKYSDALKYFSPVFHSQTPEDFNSRLTFLEQCNKQGSSVSGITNSIFGRPPVCVLRIGDFFHTKIIITNMSKVYDPLIWDMNAEGIGMQPMLCEVNLDCKMIGGQSLDGPITKLQNALDYNFYANTEVYNDIAKQTISKQNNSTSINRTTQNQKVNSQIDRMNDVSNTVQAQTIIGDTTGNASGGTISYTQRFDEIIDNLTNWSSNLLLLNANPAISPYIKADNLDVNQWNNYYSSLSIGDKNSNFQTSNLINQYYGKLKSIKNDYNTNINNLVKISQTGKDNYTLTPGQPFTNFQTMVGMVQQFYSVVILNIQLNTQANVTDELTRLIKYNRDSIDLIPYTT